MMKGFDPAAIASLTTGVALVEINKIHEAAEWVMGHPIWTHEFASKELWTDMRQRILAVLPNMPTEEPGDDWPRLVEAVRQHFGEVVMIPKGDAKRKADPLTTLEERFK